MKNILLMLFLISVLTVNLSAQNFQWAKSLGGTDDDYGYSLAVDSSGNVYTAGYFEGIADFDPGTGIYNLTATGGADIFISKVNANGDFLWAKNIGGTNYEEVNSIAVDKLGNVYAIGTFRGKVDFDPGVDSFNLVSATGVGGDDVFILKLNTDGNFIWAKKMGGSSTDNGHCLVLDNACNIYSSGMFKGTSDFDPDTSVFNLTSSANPNIFISKLDSSGKFIWAKMLGYNTDFAQGLAIAVDAAHNVYSAGYFWGTGDFNPGNAVVNLTSNGLDDIYLCKLDSNGNYLWAKNLGGNSSDQAVCLTLDAKANIYTAGYFQGISDFNPNGGGYKLTSTGLKDIFVCKLDSSGNFRWVKSMGGLKDEQPYSIALDKSANIYTTGGFSGTVDFDPGTGVFNLITSGISEVFLSKLDSSGNFGWAKNIAGVGFARGQSITTDNAGGIYACGYFGGICDFNPGPGAFYMTPAGIHDAFILKLCAPPGRSGPIVGQTSLCAGSIAAYSVPLKAGITGYLWLVPSDAVILSGQNTNSVTVHFNISSGNIVLMPSNTCGDGIADSIGVHVKPIPAVTVQPVNIDSKKGATVKFITHSSDTTSTFQWQVNNGSGYINLIDNLQYSGVTNDTLTLVSLQLTQNNDSFRCIVNAASCADTTKTVRLTVKDNTGNSYSSADLDFHVYPNPAIDHFTISMNKYSMRDLEFSMYDFAGRELLHIPCHTSQTDIDISDLPAGIYLLKCDDKTCRLQIIH